MAKVFIDGSAGTTGLRIVERLEGRKDIELIRLPEELRKDDNARRQALNNADIAFLCLPDAAAIQAVSMVDNPNTVIIDTSTAHRTAEGWTYGFPELCGKDKVASSKRIANPGCHASGFVALVKPLVDKGIISKDALLTCFSLTGYSGGGKGMIADYNSPDRDKLLDGPRQYGLTQQHKHLKEIGVLCSLNNLPAFCPIVADFYSGMEVTVPIFKSMIKGTIDDVKAVYKSVYTGDIVKFVDSADEGGFMSAAAMSGNDGMQITVCGNDDRILLISRFDNLGKGASGSAIQNMNIVLGADETAGLDL
ncbi:MAG: N-acetyl-gamma-glutamyl-phosphate reductase [Clostridia bacterium]|nr:N-acetyl-gamma-glutamyl-phosphate reductase [Clostridia bacterium]